MKARRYELVDGGYLGDDGVFTDGKIHVINEGEIPPPPTFPSIKITEVELEE